MSTKGHKGHIYCSKYPKYKPCRIHKQRSLDIIRYLNIYSCRPTDIISNGLLF